MVPPPVERRKGPDLLVRSLSWASVIALLALLAAAWVTAKAKPQMENFFEKFYRVNLYHRPGWDLELMRYMVVLFSLSGLVSIGGLIVNSRRKRRRGDFIRLTLVFCLLLSLAGLGLCIYQLSS